MLLGLCLGPWVATCNLCTILCADGCTVDLFLVMPCRPAVVLETLRGAVATQLLQPGSEVVSLFHRRLEHGYPTPSLGRDAVLEQALPWLQEAAGIWSRGRFGSYKVRTEGCC